MADAIMIPLKSIEAWMHEKCHRDEDAKRQLNEFDFCSFSSTVRASTRKFLSDRVEEAEALLEYYKSQLDDYDFETEHEYAQI